MMIGWFLFFCTCVLMLMQSITHKNALAMRDRQRENERRIWEESWQRAFGERGRKAREHEDEVLRRWMEQRRKSKTRAPD